MDNNLLVTTRALPEGVTVMDFLTSQYAWFIKGAENELIDHDEGLTLEGILRRVKELTKQKEIITQEISKHKKMARRMIGRL